MRLTILSSGSGGNALLLEAGGSRLLVDGGLRARKLRARLAELRPDLSGLGDAPASAALLTHEHTDHVCGTEDLANHGMRLFATAGTAAALSPPAQARVREVVAGHGVQHEAFHIRPFAIPHDAAEPVGYVIEAEGVRLGVLTDCGCPTPGIAAALAGSDVLVLEANHDAAMLQAGPYPTWLKRRIAADTGHLSNAQSALILGELLRAGTGPALVIAAHLSKTNNRTQLVAAALQRVIKGAARLLIAPPDGSLPLMTLGPKNKHDPGGRLSPPGQLAFAF